MRLLPLLALLVVLPTWAESQVHVAVATNFRPLLEKLNVRFETETDYTVVLSSGATGVLYHQVLSGAPYDVLLAADRRTPEALVKKLETQPDKLRCYARGKLALAGGQPGQLADPKLSVAIANPATAPYGVAATAVLSREAFLAGASRKLVRGNNAMQAYQFWHAGSVDLALVPRALAGPDASAIPAAWHPPIDQFALLLPSGQHKQAAQRYFNWLFSATVQAEILAAGYDPCL
ncbi:MAG: molybdate ABC transporter substrate-binding protein [Halieaceae bacterium]